MLRYSGLKVSRTRVLTKSTRSSRSRSGSWTEGNLRPGPATSLGLSRNAWRARSEGSQVSGSRTTKVPADDGEAGQEVWCRGEGGRSVEGHQGRESGQGQRDHSIPRGTSKAGREGCQQEYCQGKSELRCKSDRDTVVSDGNISDRRRVLLRYFYE